MSACPSAETIMGTRFATMHPIEHLRYVARSSGGDPRVLVAETSDALRGLRSDPAGLVVACRRIVQRHPLCGPLWWFCSSVLTSTEPMVTARLLAEQMDGDLTSGHLAAELPDDATICLLGWPDSVGEAVVRRGDVRVLAVDVDGVGSSFVRQLERYDVQVDLVDPCDLSSAVLASDLVLIEAWSAGDCRVVSERLSMSAAATAYCSEIPVWAIAGLGRCLPTAIVDVIVGRVGSTGGSQARGGSLGVPPTADVVPTGLIHQLVGPSGRTAMPESLAAECQVAPELLRVSPM